MRGQGDFKAGACGEGDGHWDEGVICFAFDWCGTPRGGWMWCGRRWVFGFLEDLRDSECEMTDWRLQEVCQRLPVVS